MRALSVRQPWAWLIIHAGKDIENRNWPTKVRGPVLIHAAKRMTEQEYWDAIRFCVTWCGLTKRQLPDMGQLQRGGIIGQVEIVDCVIKTPSPWFAGFYGFKLANPKPLPFRACKGSLGFFDVGEGT